MRESITFALRATLVILTMIVGVSSIILYVQAYIYKSPNFPDTDGDGFLDVDERGWWTSWLDRNDNPITTRTLPVAIGAIAVAVVLILGKVYRRRTNPSLVPTLIKKLNAMKATVSSGNRGAIESCKADFDAAITEIRSGVHREVLKEPAIQDILVEFEVLCIDAFVDDGKLDSSE